MSKPIHVWGYPCPHSSSPQEMTLSGVILTTELPPAPFGMASAGPSIITARGRHGSTEAMSSTTSAA